MQHNLFSSLDSILSVPADSGGLLIRDVAGQYRPAEADEVLQAAQRPLAAQVRGSDLMDSPAVVKDFLRSRLGHLPHEVFAVVYLDSQNRVIDYVEMFRGTVSQTSVYSARGGARCAPAQQLRSGPGAQPSQWRSASIAGRRGPDADAQVGGGAGRCADAGPLHRGGRIGQLDGGAGARLNPGAFGPISLLLISALCVGIG
jgi:hypothetical protein